MDNLYFTYDTYYKTGSYQFSNNAEGYSTENDRFHVALWMWISPDLVKKSLNESGGIIHNTFITT
jgi:hypothetical protein